MQFFNCLYESDNFHMPPHFLVEGLFMVTKGNGSERVYAQFFIMRRLEFDRSKAMKQEVSIQYLFNL